MTKGDLDIKVWGRPLKPVALGLALYCFIIFFVYITGIDPLNDNGLTGWIAALVGLAGAAGLTYSWLKNDQRVLEWSLLAATFAILTRFFSLLLIEGNDRGTYFTFAVALIAMGSYLLETTDHRKWY